MVTLLGRQENLQFGTDLMNPIVKKRIATIASHLAPDVQVAPSLRRVECEGPAPSNGELARIKALIDKFPATRTLTERIDLYNYLVRKGEEEAEKAKNKHLVIFLGSTGAGKSALINFLYGCVMGNDKQQNIVVHPDSTTKEVVKIGTARESSTLVPQVIDNSQIIGIDNKKRALAFCDMPGMDDNRGVEVALANANVMQRVIYNAKTLKFVLVVEQGQFAARAEKWNETVRLLAEKFDYRLGNIQDSLCVVFTKNILEPRRIKKEIRNYFVQGITPLNLSYYVTVYNPLSSPDRERLLQIIRGLHTYKQLPTNISLNADQINEASKLGTEMVKEIKEDLENSDMDGAIRKMVFTHGMAKMGNKELNKAQEAAAELIKDLVQKKLEEMAPKEHIRIKAKALQDYKEIKSKFRDFINFDNFDKNVLQIIQNFPDDRWVSWDKPTLTGASFFSALGFGIVGGMFCTPILAPALIATGFGAMAAKEWWNPSEDVKSKTEFYKGP